MKFNNIVTVSLFLLFGICGRICAMVVYYDTTTLNVVCWGTQDQDEYLSAYPNLKTISVKEDDPILKNPTENLRLRASDNSIQLKPQATIDAQAVKKRKSQIERDVRELRRRMNEAMQSYEQDGFNVSVETTTIRREINTLKSEYQSLP